MGGSAPCTGVMLLVLSDMELDPLNEAVEFISEPVGVVAVDDVAEDDSDGKFGMTRLCSSTLLPRVNNEPISSILR